MGPPTRENFDVHLRIKTFQKQSRSANVSSNREVVNILQKLNIGSQM